ncbi:MAG TPA: site-2 protease family protein [Solirubrobacteraceae bacterium]|nr:site-2 protease family protein [Solirubrobacteraceae bacterium]
MRPRQNLQLARIFGIRVGVSASWFVVLFIMIYWLATEYFPAILGDGTNSTTYLVAVGAALGYFASLVLHELGHALMARRLGIPVVGIDLWFLGGMSYMRREPETASEELKIAAAGPAVTLALCAIFVGAGALLTSGGRYAELAVTSGTATTTPLVALVGWLGLINVLLLVFNIVPAFPLDGGRIARAVIWLRTGDRNRATRASGRSGQAFALLVGLLGVWDFANGAVFGALTLVLAYFLYQAASQAVVAGALGSRIKDMTVSDIMDREPVTVPAQTTLLEAQEQFFLRYRWPWFAVVDPARHFLGVVRRQRVESEIAAGRPALPVVDVLEEDMPVRIGEEEPLESLLGSEGLGRLGAMVAVDSEGVLQGVVTLAQVRRALRPAT